VKYRQIKNRELHRIVSTAIIYKEGKYLITKRSPDKKVWPNRWTVPGGGFEIDDYVNLPPTTKQTWYFGLTNSLRREVKEEVGLEIGRINYLLDLTFIRPDNIPVLTLSFYAPWKKGKVKLNSESTEFVWVDAKNVDKFDLIEGIGTEIKKADAIRRGKNPEKIKFSK
jgi:8-oxo-dGTP pyrophosphatase MutT (NUDIX family)